MSHRSHIMRLLWVAALALATGCATAQPETVPLETLAAYDEDVDYGTSSRASEAQSEQAGSDECRTLRKSIENWETAYMASIGVGALGLATGVVGLLTGNEEAQKVGGAIGVLGTLSQATTATGAKIQSDKAVERDCWLPE